MLLSVHFDAGWADWQQTLLTFAEVSYVLLRVIGAMQLCGQCIGGFLG